jgi:osmotically-inducible protein OsmY
MVRSHQSIPEAGGGIIETEVGDSMDERKADREIRERVVQELESRALEGVRVRVSKGRVTLAGTVDSYAKKLAARDAAHRGTGIPELTDNIQVRLPGASARTDRELGDAIACALQFDEFVPDRLIRFTVARGKVTLEGEVESARQREDAARVVRHVAGVSGIENRIQVRGLPTPRPGRPLEGRT